MSAKKSASRRKPKTAAAYEPDPLKGELTIIGGSRSDKWNKELYDQTIQTLWLAHADPDRREQKSSATVAGLVGVRPQDELEGMIGAQLLAAHNAAMESYRRAMIGGQTLEGRRDNLSQANKLSRTYAMLLEALNRHRGKGQQKVTVEHVHVHAGGQAVVGVVEAPGGGDRQKSEDQPYAKQIAHASEPAMWSAEEERGLVPVPGYAERSMSAARRNVPRRPKGK